MNELFLKKALAYILNNKVALYLALVMAIFFIYKAGKITGHFIKSFY